MFEQVNKLKGEIALIKEQNRKLEAEKNQLKETVELSKDSVKHLEKM